MADQRGGFIFLLLLLFVCLLVCFCLLLGVFFWFVCFLFFRYVYSEIGVFVEAYFSFDFLLLL